MVYTYAFITKHYVVFVNFDSSGQVESCMKDLCICNIYKMLVIWCCEENAGPWRDSLMIMNTRFIQ